MNQTATVPKCENDEPLCAPFETKDAFEPKRLSDQKLLALLFSANLPAQKALALAEKWLAEYGSLRELISAAEGNVTTRHALNLTRSDRLCMQTLQVCGEIFTRALREGLQRGTALTSPSDTLDYLQRSLQDRRREIFYCMFLDTRHRVICHQELFQGSIDGACVYPRVVAEHALRYNAAAVIVAHNHPSGVTEPSLADQAITRRLKDALALLEIRLLDHFVIGDGAPVSLASRGMI